MQVAVREYTFMIAEPISIDVDGGEDETFVILTLTGGLHFTF